MALKLNPPVEQTFALEESDKLFGSSGTTVTIRQATQREHERRQQLFESINSRYHGVSDEVEIIQRFNFLELQRMEVFLTLADCNIESENGKSLFKFKKSGNQSILAMDQTDFASAWGLLPPSVAREIHSKVREVNIDWNPSGEVS